MNQTPSVRSSRQCWWRYVALWAACVQVLAMVTLGNKATACVVAQAILLAASVVLVAVLVVAYSRHRLWGDMLPVLSLFALLFLTAVFWQCFVMMLADIQAVRMFAATTQPAPPPTSSP